jgi:protein arginine N-methyltransferase 5
LVEGDFEDGGGSGGAGAGAGGGNNNNARPEHHLQYLRHLRTRPDLRSRLDAEEATLETPYLDNLQSPLQPLGDHLEYQTYETFEKDPVKYERYGMAISLALEDGMRSGRYPLLGLMAKTTDAENADVVDLHRVTIHRVTILVVGAGRGPLVREAIGAVARVSAMLASDEGRGDDDGDGNGRRRRMRRALHARIVAIEKNPSAVLYLRGLKCADPSWNGGRDYDPRDDDDYDDDDADGGGGSGGIRASSSAEEGGQRRGGRSIVIPGTSVVTVVGCDMREASSDPSLARMTRGDESSRADIVVSELLGSFGDNELSPECLDGVQRCGILKEDCVSIPQK